MTTIHETLRGNGQSLSVQNMQTSLQLLSLIMNNIPQAIFWKDQNLGFLGCNQAFVEDAGFTSPQDIIGKSDFDMPWKDHAELYRADDRRVMESGEAKINYEEPHTASDGSKTWVRTSKIPVYENGQIIAVLGLYEDITEHKRAENILQLSEANLSAALHVANMGLWEYDIDTQLFTFNDQYYSLHGTTAEKVGGYQMSVQRFAQEFVYPADGPTVGQATQQAIETSDPNFHVQTEARIMHADGKPRWTTVWFRIEKDAQGRTIKLHGVSQDITERKQAEEATRKSEENFRAIADFAYDWETWLKPDGKFIYISPACERISGYAPSAFKEDPNLFLEITHPEDKLLIEAHLHDHNSTADTKPIEYRIITKNGSIRWISHSCRAIYDSTGTWQGRRGSNIDITERKNAEKALIESETRFRSLFEQSADAILILENGIFMDCNQATVRMMRAANKEQFLSLHPSRLSPEYQPDGRASGEKADDMMRIALEKGSNRFEWIHRRLDGSDFPVEVLLTLISTGDRQIIHTVWRDITERKHLEQEIQNALERRGLQVQLSTQVSQSIAAAASLEELYERVVTQVKEQFGYYHTQILRYDATQEAVVLVTGYGEVGATMLAAGHHLPMGEGLIGTAAATGETILRSVLENDSDWQPNPLLPATKGEIAVPIKLGDTILGVLDVQNDVAGALDADDQLLLEGLCGQIAIAIESTRLHQEMAERLEEINRLYRAMSHEGWKTYQDIADAPSGFLFDQGGLRPAASVSLADELFASIPLTVPGGEVIGTLAVADDLQRPISPDDEDFLLQVSEQVALALESARLFEQTQSALATAQESEERLSEALNIAKLANWEYDVERDRFIFNDHFYSIFHTTVEEVGRYEISSAEYAARFVHPEDVHMVGQEIAKALASTDRHYNVHLEHRILFAGGGVGYISADVHIERDEQGNILRYYGANQDITERKRAEEAIKAEQQRVKLILESVTVPMVITRLADNHLTFVNSPALDVTQFQYEDVIDRPSPDFYYNLDDRKNFIAELKASGRVADMVVQLRRSGGEPFWALLSARIFDYQEETSILSTFMDISDRMRAQEAIAKRATELAAVANVSTTASTLLDPDRLLQSVVDLTRDRFNLYHVHIYLADESWQTLLLAAGAGEAGRKMVSDGWNIAMDHQSSIVAEAARNRQPVIANDVYHDKESSFLSNRLLPDTRSEMAVPIIVGEKLLGVFDVQSDVTGNFTDEDANIYITLASQVGVALQNARLYVEQSATLTQLRELDKLKSSFLANMSHELRTPLNSILGFTDVMLEGLDGELTDYMDNDLRLIQKNGQHLLHLINDVLDMAKIESGRMNLNPETFKIHSVLEEVTSITSTLASEKNLSLFIEENSDQKIEVYADNTRLRQVMINLVNNAIKFTEKGTIRICASPMEGARVLIAVKDTGIGISSENLESIFQEFTQVDTSSTRKVGGTGLGLPISRRLVEMHGGRLWAESAGIHGEGSTFFVELPVEARISEVIEKPVK